MNTNFHTMYSSPIISRKTNNLSLLTNESVDDLTKKLSLTNICSISEKCPFYDVGCTEIYYSNMDKVRHNYTYYNKHMDLLHEKVMKLSFGSLPNIMSGELRWEIQNFNTLKDLKNGQYIESRPFFKGELTIRMRLYPAGVPSTSDGYFDMSLEIYRDKEFILENLFDWVVKIKVRSQDGLHDNDICYDFYRASTRANAACTAPIKRGLSLRKSLKLRKIESKNIEHNRYMFSIINPLQGQELKENVHIKNNSIIIDIII